MQIGLRSISRSPWLSGQVQYKKPTIYGEGPVPAEERIFFKNNFLRMTGRTRGYTHGLINKYEVTTCNIKFSLK